jgi:hypothetical protein
MISNGDFTEEEGNFAWTSTEYHSIYGAGGVCVKSMLAVAGTGMPPVAVVAVRAGPHHRLALSSGDRPSPPLSPE